MKRTPREGAPRRSWGEDDSGCPILHVDMDAFFALVEIRDRPELKGKPVIIGGGNRSVVLSATYEARALGVHSAMPMARARMQCPQAIVIPPSHGIYHEISADVMGIFREITELVEPLSVDEAFLDVGGARRRLGPPLEIGRMIREEVEKRHRITCSVGIASTKFVAKLASGEAKPDGMLLISADQTLDFLRSLPAGALWGVGQKTAEALERWGIETVAELADTPLATLQRAVGRASGAHLHALAWGRDPRPVVPTHQEKSVGAETTYGEDTADRSTLNATLLYLAERCGRRLRASGAVGRTISIKVRRSDFSTITRSKALRRPTDVSSDIYAAALELFEQSGALGEPIRLLGVRVEQLSEESETPHQLELGEEGPGRRDLELAADRARDRFGKAAIRPATLLPSKPAFPDR